MIGHNRLWVAEIHLHCSLRLWINGILKLLEAYVAVLIQDAVLGFAFQNGDKAVGERTGICYCAVQAEYALKTQLDTHFTGVMSKLTLVRRGERRRQLVQTVLVAASQPLFGGLDTLRS